MEEARMYSKEMDLVDAVLDTLQEMRMSKAELALRLNVSRSMVSQYLNRKYTSDTTELEASLRTWLMEMKGEEVKAAQEVSFQIKARPLQKVEYFESRDYVAVIGLCQLCQEEGARGIVTGRSGYGKTFSLKKYAQLPRVAYIECNEAMNQKDLIRKIEKAVGLPKAYGSIDERMERVTDFFNTASGYLLIIDEADKLITKYTQKKIELLRAITDIAQVGVVLAGEPMLEGLLKAYDQRFANRMEFGYNLCGLTEQEVKEYFEGFEIDDAALSELVIRACNKQTGCFRLLDRTFNNILRIMKEQQGNVITMKVVKEASRMMIL